MNGLLSRLPSLLLALGLAYVTYEGGAWRGVMSMSVAPRTLWLLGNAIGAWLIWRTVRRFAWERTALDLAMPLWILAFMLSTLSNIEKLPRMGYGLWFAALYIALWYSLHDLVRHGTGWQGAVNALLFSALPPLLTSIRQLEFSRIGGSLENPNILAAFLVLVTPIAIARFLAPPPNWTQGVRRVALGVLVGALCLATYLTGSRGAWLGMIAAAVIGVWAWQGGRIRAIWLIGGATPLLIVVALLLVGMRMNDPRLDFYRQALDYFAAQPLIGNGLFTSKYYEPLPYRPGFVFLHVHAHNAPLHVAAELGILGIAALGVTTVLTMRGALINWRHAEGTEKTLRAGALAALAGFGAHHMVDFPVITPAVAVTLIVVLIIALLPDPPQTRRGGQALQTLLIAALWLSLVTIGQINLATVWEGVRNAVNRGIP